MNIYLLCTFFILILPKCSDNNIKLHHLKINEEFTDTVADANALLWTGASTQLVNNNQRTVGCVVDDVRHLGVQFLNENNYY